MKHLLFLRVLVFQIFHFLLILSLLMGYQASISPIPTQPILAMSHEYCGSPVVDLLSSTTGKLQREGLMDHPQRKHCFIPSPLTMKSLAWICVVFLQKIVLTVLDHLTYLPDPPQSPSNILFFLATMVKC